MIAADFGGRSIDFQTREIADYQPIIGALMKITHYNPDLIIFGCGCNLYRRN